MHTLRTLGAVEVADGAGRPLRSLLRQQKRLALFVYLTATANIGPRRRDSLLALFWPELDGERARHALRQALYYLRNQLGPDAIVTRGDDEVAVVDVRCDAVALRQAVAEGRPAEAVELSRGPFLDGFHVDDVSPDFEQWMAAQRAEIGQLAAGAAWEMAERCEAAGQGTGAVAWARRASRMDPLDESSVQRLMHVLDRHGDRSAAVAVFEEFAARLRDEYDLEPAPETAELLARLRGRSEAHDGAATRKRWRQPQEPRRRSGGPPSGGGASTAVAGANASTQPGGWADAARDAAAERARDPVVRVPRGWAPARAGRLTLAPADARREAPYAPLLETVSPWLAPPKRTRWLRLALWIGIPALLVAAAAVGAILLRGRAAATGEVGRRVVVLPFTVHGGADQAFLSEGFVDLLSTGVDGAGDLVSVRPAAVLDYLARPGTTAPQNPEERMRLAARFGAELFVTGDVVAVGDRLRATAWLYDRAMPGIPVLRAQAEGGRGELLSISDRLAMAIAAGPDGRPDTRLARVASAATSSLDAMKAYLVGEQLYRRGALVASIEAFRRALDADSTFALAYYGLSLAASAAFQGREADDAARQATRYMDRLPERERRLLAARAAYRAGDGATAERLARDLLFRYPNDTEAWSQLGEVQMHLNPVRGADFENAQATFERLRSLVPREAEAIYHLAQLAAYRRDWPEVDRLAREGLALNPEGHRAHQLDLLVAAARGGGVLDGATVRSELASADEFAIVSSAYTLAVHIGDLTSADAALGLLQSPSRAPAIRAFSLLVAAQLELARGRWKAARARLAQARRLDPLRATEYEVLLATTPWLASDADTLAALRARLRILAASREAPPEAALGPWDAVDRPVADMLTPYLDGRLAAVLGDSAGVRQDATDLQDNEARPLLAGRYARDLAFAMAPTGSASAYDAVAGGSAAMATGVAPEEAVLSPFFSMPWARYAAADALARAGDVDDADVAYESLGQLSIPDLVYRGPAHVRQAELALRRGDREAAIRHFQAFVDLWHDCDPELRPVLERIRQRIAALTPS